MCTALHNGNFHFVLFIFSSVSSLACYKVKICLDATGLMYPKTSLPVLEDSRHMLARLCTFFSLTLCTVGKTTNADRVSIKTVQDCAVLYL
jgi:hypothetical protein